MKGRIIKLTAVLASAVIGITGCGVSAVDQSMPEVVAVSGAADESADVAKGAPEDGTTLAQVPAESESKTNDESEKVIEESEAVEDSEEVVNEGEKAVDESSKAIEESEVADEAVKENKTDSKNESKTNTDGTNVNSTAKGTASDDAERQAAEKAAREEAERQAAEKAAREEAERQAAASQGQQNQGQSSAVNQVGSQFQDETPEERQARLEQQAAEAAQKSAEYEAAKKAAEEEAARKAAEEEAARQQYSETYSCECGHWSYTIHSADELDAFYTALDAHQSECGSGRFGGGVN